MTYLVVYVSLSLSHQDEEKALLQLERILAWSHLSADAEVEDVRRRAIDLLARLSWEELKELAKTLAVPAIFKNPLHQYPPYQQVYQQHQAGGDSVAGIQGAEKEG